MTNNNPNRREGFSLIEMIVVVLVIGIVATTCIVALASTQQRAIVETTIQEVATFQAAAIAFNTMNGRWPKNASTGEFPADFDGYLSPNDFSRQPACGGRWDWNGIGTGMPKIGMSIRFETDEYSQVLCLAIDTAMDDGNLKTGRVDIDGHVEQNKSGRRFLQFHLDDK